MYMYVWLLYCIYVYALYACIVCIYVSIYIWFPMLMSGISDSHAPREQIWDGVLRLPKAVNMSILSAFSDSFPSFCQLTMVAR